MKAVHTDLCLMVCVSVCVSGSLVLDSASAWNVLCSCPGHDLTGITKKALESCMHLKVDKKADEKPEIDARSSTSNRLE